MQYPRDNRFRWQDEPRLDTDNRGHEMLGGILFVAFLAVAFAGGFLLGYSL